MTSHVYITINLFNLCQQSFLLFYIYFLKCWHRLNEPFRYRYPNRKSYTFTNNRGQGSRIDKIYIPTLWCDKIKQTTHIPFEKSDHKAVILVLKCQREKWGNSYWKFNESLLENENYIKLIEKFWKGWQSEKLTRKQT